MRAPISRRPGRVAAGTVAAACGTTALNFLTYLDMTVRGRPASQVPAEMADRSAATLGVDLGEGDTRRNRREGLGALMGYGAGLWAGSVFLLGGNRFEGLPLSAQGAVLAGAAIVVGNVPPVAMGITDPRDWSPADWLSDVVPHLGYGLAAAAVYRMLRR